MLASDLANTLLGRAEGLVIRSADTDRVFARRTGLGWGHRDKSSGPALEEFSGLEGGAGGGGHGNNYSTL